MKKLCTILGLLGVLSANPVSQASAQTGGKLVLTGSSTVAPLAAEIGKRFEARNPGTRVDVQTGGSARGLTDARQGLADIGMVSRALKEDEQDLHGFAIARDGITVIVHESNPVTSLSDDEITDIYTGKITNWRAVGGNNAPVTVVNKAEGRSTLELFLHYFKLKSPDIKPHVVIGDNEQGIKTVAGNPDAIGYVSVGAAEYNAAHGVPLKLLPVSDVAAATENIRNGAFPLSRPLTLVTKKPPQGLSKEFIEFARSKEVHDIVAELGFVPLAE